MITIETGHPVASDSLDHLHPHGTSWDNSVWPPFNKKLFALTQCPRLLDIGCAGGGLVRSIIDDGGFAVGIEGSDYSLQRQRAEWATIPGNLFTADATQPFQLYEDGNPAQFDIVTLWEVFEHIPTEKIVGLLDNIKRHMTDDGVLIVSICWNTAGLSPEGIDHHVTVHHPEWWYDEVFYPNGFTTDEDLRRYFDPDWVRGILNGCYESFSHAFRKISQ